MRNGWAESQAQTGILSFSVTSNASAGLSRFSPLLSLVLDSGLEHAERDVSCKTTMTLTLFDNLVEIERRIGATGRILLFLDFDGTLASITEEPARAQLSPAARTALTELSRRHELTVAVISGRRLSDIRARVGIPGIIYAGNHGLEIDSGSWSFRVFEATRLRPILLSLCRQIRDEVECIPGVLVEDKLLTLSVHYRLASDYDAKRVVRLVRAITATFSDWFKVTQGRKVLEVRPRISWDKGTAVTWIRQRLGNHNTLAIYVGDDSTDEDAFAVLRDGISVRVGSSDTLAGYELADPDLVCRFLRWLNSALDLRIESTRTPSSSG